MQHCCSVPQTEILRSERPTESEPFPKVRKIREREERVVATLQPVVIVSNFNVLVCGCVRENLTQTYAVGFLRIVEDGIVDRERRDAQRR